MTPLRLGTRGSLLARTQSQQVADALTAATGRPVELVIIRSEGDDVRIPLDAPSRPGAFVATLRDSLLAGEVDLVVHSFKDLPSAPMPGLVVAAIPPRADPRDALCATSGLTWGTLPPGARVGTSSPRRAAGLLRVRPDLEIVPIRGNVDTRLRKVAEGEVDAAVLAAAGLVRVGREAAITQWLDPATWLPAPAQGALAVETRVGVLEAELASLDDLSTRLQVTAERAVLVGIEATCTTAVGALASWLAPGELELAAELSGHRGVDHARVVLRAPVTGLRDAERLGLAVAAALTSRPMLLIRPDGNESDAKALAAIGVPSVIEPLLRVTPVADAGPARELADLLDTAEDGHWLVLTSPRTWRIWGELVDDVDARLARAIERGLRIATVGQATTASLPEATRQVTLTSPGISADELLEMLLTTTTGVALLPASAGARPMLAEGLRSAGWRVHAVPIYQTRPLEAPPESLEGLANGRFAGVLVRSSSAADALASLAPGPLDVPVFAVGPITAARCRSYGWRVIELDRPHEGES